MRLWTTLWFNNGYNSGWYVIASGGAYVTQWGTYVEAWVDYPCGGVGWFQGEGVGYVQSPAGYQPPDEYGYSWSNVVYSPC